MKRSQLIERIIYQALSWDGLKIDSCGVPLEEIVSDILDVCEDSGMLPPQIDTEYQCDTWGTFPVRINAWEKE